MADGGKSGFSEHDDRVGGGGSSNRGFAGRRRKGRGPFRGKMYSEMNHHQKNWSGAGSGPRSRGEDEDVLMSDPHDPLRSRYTPYGHRPNRPDRERGGLSNINLTVRKNLGVSEQSFPIGCASRTTWFKITIPYGWKYEKGWLFTALQNVCTVPFIPLEVHYANNRIVFYVDDSAAANALRHVSRKIVDSDGYKVQIIVYPCNRPPTVQHDLKPEELEHLTQCMSKRYDGSQQALDLKSLRTDPDLVAQNIDVVLNRRNCMLNVLRIIEENIPELLSLNLSYNKLYRLDDMADLCQKAPNLKILNLSSNQLKAERDLDRLKGLKLEELWLDGNPLCDSFADQSTYISTVRERFPKLLRLDGHELPPPISFDVEAPPTSLPASKGSYFPSDDLKVLILRFVQQYFTIYDSGDRQALLNAYHDGACCSLSIPAIKYNPSRGSLSEYFKYSRNVKKLRDPAMRFRLLKHTRLNVVAFLNELPKTQHDINSFVVDVCAQTNTLLCFTLNGLFKQVDGKCRDLMWAFSRVFIAVPAANNGLCVINDELFIRKANEEEMRKAFDMPAPTPSSSPVPTLSAEQQEMLQAFSLQSGMNLEWSQKCLSDNGWDYTHAAGVFTQLKAQGKIPEVAFLN